MVNACNPGTKEQEFKVVLGYTAEVGASLDYLPQTQTIKQNNEDNYNIYSLFEV